MVTVFFKEDIDRYVVMRRGQIVSRHNLARRAKEKGKRLGRKFGEPVSYEPRRGETRFIFSPEPDNQFGMM